ncbi:MAG: MerR family DNA-binding transcriptional regulator, partial [Nitrospiria bacterium]
MDGLTIGRLAKAASVHVETIRYYERRGLIPKPSRRA